MYEKSKTMNSWKSIKLSDVCYFSSDKIEVSNLSLDNYVSTENMLPNKSGICRAANLPNTPLTVAFNFGDILLSNIRPYFKKIWLANFNGGCSNDVLVLKAKESIDAKFLYYILSDNKFFDYDTANAKGTKMPRGDKAAIMNYEFSLPPLDVQKKIAGVLGALDDKIELNNRINNNLEQQAQSLFNNIYNTNNNGTLADIVDVVESGSRPKGGAINKGIPSIGAENIEKFGVYDYSKEKFIDEIFYEKMKHGKVATGDVLLYKDGAYTGKVSLALDGYPHRICAVNEHVFIIRGKSDVTSQFFLYFCLSDEKNKNYLHTLASSKAAQPGLNQSELLGLPIFIPASAVVKNFTLSVAPMMHKIASNAIENNKLSALRDTLLPKLMSGEIDVSNVDISALTSTDKLSFTE